MMKQTIKQHFVAAVALLAAAVTLPGLDAAAQVSVGAGYLSGRLKESQGGISQTTATDGFYVGFSYRVPLNVYELSFEPGVFYGYGVGTQDLQGVGVVDLNLQDLYVPLRLRIDSPISPKFDVFASAGPTLGLGLSGEVRSMGIGVNLYDSSIMKGSALKRFDVQFGAEAGFMLWNHLQFRLGFGLGLLDVEEGATTGKRSSVHFGVAYVF